MRSRFAFDLDDLAALLTLELAEPGDAADIDTIYEILLRRAATGLATPTAPEPERDPRRPGLYAVPDPG